MTYQPYIRTRVSGISNVDTKFSGIPFIELEEYMSFVVKSPRKTRRALFLRINFEVHCGKILPHQIVGFRAVCATPPRSFDSLVTSIALHRVMHVLYAVR